LQEKRFAWRIARPAESRDRKMRKLLIFFRLALYVKRTPGPLLLAYISIDISAWAVQARKWF